MSIPAGETGGQRPGGWKNGWWREGGRRGWERSFSFRFAVQDRAVPSGKCMNGHQGTTRQRESMHFGGTTVYRETTVHLTQLLLYPGKIRRQGLSSPDPCPVPHPDSGPPGDLMHQAGS